MKEIQILKKWIRLFIGLWRFIIKR